MSKELFSVLLSSIVRDFVSYTSRRDKIDAKRIAKSFYFSELYKELENEKTKVWRFSTPTLYQLYHDEIDRGKIEWPDVI